jgi:hypothetical protein
MIMQGSISRALTRVGPLGLLGVGLFLLFLMPGWAQEKEKPAPRGDKQTPEVRQLMEQLQRLTAEMERKRAEIAELEAAVDKARAEMARRVGAVPKREETARGRGEAREGDRGRKPKTPLPQGDRFRPPLGPPGEIEHRLAEINMKMDRVLHELQELRRELRLPPRPPGEERPIPGRGDRRDRPPRDRDVQPPRDRDVPPPPRDRDPQPPRDRDVPAPRDRDVPPPPPPERVR